MTGELYKKYRPKKFSEVIGQNEAITTLKGFGKSNLPHTILFTGNSGCGKTTLARILRRKIKCSKHDFKEVNCADFRGIEMVREIRQRMGLAPMNGKCRVWLIDEAHQMTSAGQDACLKLLEDTPDHVFFFLATTDPDKLKATILTRCTEIKVRLLTPKEVKGLLIDVIRKERVNMEEDVIDKIVDMAEGSARKALVLLNQVIGIEETEDQLEVLEKSKVKKQGFEIAQALLKKTSWKAMVGMLDHCHEEPEKIRHVILSFMSSVLLGGSPNKQAYFILDTFVESSFIYTKRAGLIAACYDVLVGEDSE